METLQTIMGERRTYSDVGFSHEHSFGQLILPLRGTLLLETQGYPQAPPFELDDSSVFFLPPGCLHYFYACDTNEFLILDIPAHLIGQLATHHASQGIRVEFGVRWQAIRTLLLAEFDASSERQVPESTPPSGALLHLVQYISSLLSQGCEPRSLRYLHQHYHHPLDVAQLAQLEGYNRAYYSEWFKAQTGKSPQAYLQDLRLKQAQELLQYTDLPIYQIAQQVGFEQASSLTRLFRQRQGITPQRYRTKTQHSAKPFPTSG
ncbi:MAG: helix-turn-helix transcriptional regulator [Leptolyngbya sp. SIO1D8]|nr:helix-turn-helix transcriptional regulator [Leptolyngbya sp. SIO1D8]